MTERKFMLLTSFKRRCIVTMTIDACGVTSVLLSRASHKEHLYVCISYKFSVPIRSKYFSRLIFWRYSNENSQNYTAMFAMSVCPFVSTELLNTIKVYHSPANAQVIVLKNSVKMYVK